MAFLYTEAPTNRPTPSPTETPTNSPTPFSTKAPTDGPTLAKTDPNAKTKTRILRLNKIPFLTGEPTTAPTVGPATTASADPPKGPTVYPTTAVPIRRPARTPATTILTAGTDKHRRSRDEDDEREEDVLVYDPLLRHQRRK